VIRRSCPVAPWPGQLNRSAKSVKGDTETKMSDPKALFAGLAIVVSLISLVFTLFDRQRVRIETVIEGLRGDNASVTYTALYIRLSKLLKKRKYRHSLISALLLAWNFQQSDRARASVLMALVNAKRKYAKDYIKAVGDLTAQFDLYASVKGEEDIGKRGKARLKDVLEAIEKAEAPSLLH
jgi:hypothetical protein